MNRASPSLNAPAAGAETPQSAVAKRGEAKSGDIGARERLLNAAAIAFMERGYSGTSIDDIAAVMSATKGAIYHHFSSKADVYFAVQDRAMQRIETLVSPVFAKDASPELKLHAMAMEHLMAIFTDFPGTKVAVQGLEQSLMKAAGIAERRQLQRIVRMRDAYESMFRTVIEAGARDGLFIDAPAGVLAKGVLGALNWSTLWFDPARTKSKASMIALARTLSDYAVRGLQRPPSNAR